MSRKEEKKFSEFLSEICKLFDEVPKEYDRHYSEIHTLDLLTQDYLHALELDGLLYEERAKVATKIMRSRKERRDHKDALEILQPLVDYLQTDYGKRALKMLREVLGKTRKVEDYHSVRSYRPKVLVKETT